MSELLSTQSTVGKLVVTNLASSHQALFQVALFKDTRLCLVEMVSPNAGQEVGLKL